MCPTLPCGVPYAMKMAMLSLMQSGRQFASLQCSLLALTSSPSPMFPKLGPNRHARRCISSGTFCWSGLQLFESLSPWHPSFPFVSGSTRLITPSVVCYMMRPLHVLPPLSPVHQHLQALAHFTPLLTSVLLNVLLLAVPLLPLLIFLLPPILLNVPLLVAALLPLLLTSPPPLPLHPLSAIIPLPLVMLLSSPLKGTPNHLQLW